MTSTMPQLSPHVLLPLISVLFFTYLTFFLYHSPKMNVSGSPPRVTSNKHTPVFK
uniref:ATP synthase F0 subunit 8 n=1 Tax=Karaftohelix adamsi TaxID=2013957 RepID=A0A8J9WB45_9EUPU|nr:ATP synthase F0 subunit 8 [Karaftohelix adamsi]